MAEWVDLLAQRNQGLQHDFSSYRIAVHVLLSIIDTLVTGVGTLLAP